MEVSLIRTFGKIPLIPDAPQVSVTNYEKEKPKPKDLTYEEEANLRMKRSRPQFDVMSGLSVLGISLDRFREITSKRDKNEVKTRALYFSFFL